MAEVEHDLEARLDESKIKRARMLKRFGFIPASVLKLSRGALSASLFNLAQETPGRSLGGADNLGREESYKSDAAKAKAEARRKKGLLGGITEMPANNRTTLSIMAGELVEFTIRYYCPPGGTYLDPFAGHGVRAQVSKRMGVTYQGCDLSEEFVGYTTAALARTAGDTDAEVRLCDARTPWFEDDTGDFSFTSPPYWDIEHYGTHPGQLGTGKTYDEFMEGMREAYAALRPKLKTGAWVVININDIRRDKKFYPYHSDLLQTVQSIEGYSLHDTWILEGLVSGLPRAFGVDFNEHKIAPKVHEYLLVFRCD